MPLPPPPKNHKKPKIQLMINLLSIITLSPLLQRPLPNILTHDNLDQQSPTSHIHWEISINISKSPPTPKKTEKIWKLTIHLLSTTSLPPTLSPLFIQRLPHNNLAPQYPTPHIYWEIAVFIPPQPPQKPRKSQKLQLAIKLLCTTPLPSTLHPLLPTMLPPKYLARQSPAPYIHR